MGYAYTRFSLELRYPFMLGASTNVFGLIFAEGGNCWSSIGEFNPFDMKKSVGVGARIFLPMVGLLGIDWSGILIAYVRIHREIAIHYEASPPLTS